MKMYYLENKERGPRGNKIIWWGKRNFGYTCDINEAKEFTEQEADNILSTSSAKYNKHEAAYIKRVATPYVDPKDLLRVWKHVREEQGNGIPGFKIIFETVVDENGENLFRTHDAKVAQLAAAAPELLAALKAAIGLPYAIQPANWHETAHKAIAKAQGE